MSINRYAARTDSNQAEIVAALRAAGCSVWIIGLPVDLLVGNNGKTLCVEVKRMTGKLVPKPTKHTKLQREFMMSWTGGPVATVTDAESALRAVGAMA